MARRISVLLLILLLAIPCAWAEELPDDVMAAVPGGALVRTDEAGSLRFYTLSLPETGEEVLVTCGAEGVLFAQTQQEAICSSDAAPMERSRAEELVREAYPGCRILFAEDAETGKRLGVAGDNFCGSIVVADGRIRSRTLEMGEIYRDGRLTMDGALRVLTLHRPEAEFRALELDEDDGLYVYEGEALLGGEYYEFELDVASGRLLEWERD